MTPTEYTAPVDSRGRELIRHGTEAFPVACYQDGPVPWHWHDELEALVVTGGEMVVAAGNRRYTVAQGDGFFVNAGVLHGAWQAEGAAACRFRSVVFHPRLVGGQEGSVFWRDYLDPLLADNGLQWLHLRQGDLGHREALSAIGEAWQSYAREEAGYEFRVREALSRLVLALSGHSGQERQPGDRALREAGRMKRMLRYIEDHYGEEITAGQIAGAAAVSESECLRCFRGVIGTTPIQYLIQFRIRRAAELLASTDRKIADIGAECGFQEMSYFARTFRRLRGCTPSEYRALASGGRVKYNGGEEQQAGGGHEI